MKHQLEEQALESRYFEIDNKDGRIKIIPFYDAPSTKPAASNYVALSAQQWQECAACRTADYFVYDKESGEILRKEDSTIVAHEQLQNHYAELQKYLDETDYVVSKLNELRLEQDQTEYEAAREQYKEVLQKRKAARAELASRK